MTTRPLGHAPLAVSLGTLICTCFGSGQSGDAADFNPPPPVRVAASAIDSDQPARTRNELRSDGKFELEWLLAQGAGQTSVEARAETIIAVFPSSAPESVEEDVAKAHKLELVRRLAIGPSDKRIVVYRIGDGPQCRRSRCRSQRRSSRRQRAGQCTLHPAAAAAARAACSERREATARASGKARPTTDVTAGCEGQTTSRGIEG